MSIRPTRSAVALFVALGVLAGAGWGLRHRLAAELLLARAPNESKEWLPEATLQRLRDTLASDASAARRAKAAQLLGRTEQSIERGLPVLFAALRDPDGSVSQVAAQAISKCTRGSSNDPVNQWIRARPREELLGTVRSATSEGARLLIYGILGAFRSEIGREASEILLSQDTDPKTARNVCFEVTCPYREGVPPELVEDMKRVLLAGLGNPNPEIATMCLHRLVMEGGLGLTETQIVEVLSRTDDSYVYQHAAAALAQRSWQGLDSAVAARLSKDPEFASKVLNGLDQPWSLGTDRARKIARDALARAGQDVRSVIEEWLEKPEEKRHGE